jgi:beta-phosphoglucomutase-like phosphatase (HAD superfamily)
MALAAILDVDGTLLDSNYHHALAWYRAFRAQGVTPPVWRIHKLVRAEDEVEHYIELLDARELADAWTTSADVDETKPAPDLVAAALRKAGGLSAAAVFDSLIALREHLDETPLR